MKIEANTVQEYLDNIQEERKPAINRLRDIIKDNIPVGFEECINYGMIGYVVPHTIYPDGYHCNTKLPLPFLNIANQKNFVAIYHMGIYANPDLMAWFIKEYPKHCKYKIDIGKSCIRFKKIDHIPYGLIEELVKKMTINDWISIYEENVKSK
tara:strand:+ start:72 stop:530 length:459 start_codon:yes stop_codon:yes gene_type:complete